MTDQSALERLSSAVELVARDCAETPISLLIDCLVSAEKGSIVRLHLPNLQSATEFAVDLQQEPAGYIADIAENVQDWIVEELHALNFEPIWPACPLHPHTHPLRPRPRDGRAWWQCPGTGQFAHLVGALSGREHQTDGDD
jgi:hypothetical protein